MPTPRLACVMQAACVAAAATALSAHAREPAAAPGEPLVLRLETTLRPAREAGGALPVFVQGTRIEGEAGRHTVVQGEAELRKQDTAIKADRIRYDVLDDELEARGGVRVLRHGDLFTGTELRLKLDARTGLFLSAEYLLANDRARGRAGRLEFLGPDSYRATDATYSTCGPDNDDWHLQVGELKLDYGRDAGEA
ncbi:MAG: LPS-assembly protein LptD, partial [Burkholderiales bacterium]|nr:LPS-assembly protein LptD [Burkholderiales bacterium]